MNLNRPNNRITIEKRLCAEIAISQSRQPARAAQKNPTALLNGALKQPGVRDPMAGGMPAVNAHLGASAGSGGRLSIIAGRCRAASPASLRDGSSRLRGAARQRHPALAIPRGYGDFGAQLRSRRSTAREDETHFLDPRFANAGSGRTPAEDLLDDYGTRSGGVTDPVFTDYAY
jgi:hypothetical protein